MNTTLGTIIMSFFCDYLQKEKNCSPNTVTSYSDCVRLLLCFCCKSLNRKIDELKPQELSDKLVIKFLNYLEEERGNSVNTRNQRLAVIKTFFRYLAEQIPERLAVCAMVCAINRKKRDHKIIGSLTEKEVKSIIEAPDTAERTGLRDHAMLLFMYNTGARVQEVADLTIGDLSTEGFPQVLITGKGRKQRVTPLWDETIQALHNYLKSRERSTDDKDEYLFINKNKNKLTRHGIRCVVQKRTRQATELCPELADMNITPHTFRHTTALSLIRSGVDIVTVKEWLGHADIKTTMLYLEIDMKMKEDALMKYPPPVSSGIRGKAQWKQPAILEFLNKLCRRRYVV